MRIDYTKLASKAQPRSKQKNQTTQNQINIKKTQTFKMENQARWKEKGRLSQISVRERERVD